MTTSASGGDTTAPPSVSATPQRRRNRGLLIGGWVSTGIAVATLGAALGLFLWNNSQYDDWEVERAFLVDAYGSTGSTPLDAQELGERAVDHDALGERISTIDSVSAALLGVGAAAAAAAVVLVVLGFRGVGADTSAGTNRVSLLPSPGGLVVSTNWSTP